MVKVLDLWVQLMKNGGKNESVVFIILVGVIITDIIKENNSVQHLRGNVPNETDMQWLTLEICYDLILCTALTCIWLALGSSGQAKSVRLDSGHVSCLI